MGRFAELDRDPALAEPRLEGGRQSRQAAGEPPATERSLDVVADRDESGSGVPVMSTVLQAQSFEAQKLNRQVAELETQQQLLSREVDKLQSPANVARRAIAYGMVPNTNPAFLRLSDGKVLGKPEAAQPGKTNIRSVTP